jgi:hypothetical protein
MFKKVQYLYKLDGESEHKMIVGQGYQGFGVSGREPKKRPLDNRPAEVKQADTWADQTREPTCKAQSVHNCYLLDSAISHALFVHSHTAHDRNLR